VRLRWLTALLLLHVPAFAMAQARAVPVLAEVAIVRDGDSWIADYRLHRRAGAWGLVRSNLTEVGSQPWRPQSWDVITPGVRLERRGHYDVIATTDGRPVPPRVRIRFAPFGRRVAGDYDPALIFSDGSTALYSDHFDVFPVASAAAAARLPRELGESDIPQTATRATFTDRGAQVRYRGQRVRTASVTDDEGAYILFGPVPGIETGQLSLVVDPRLPEWIGAAIIRATPQILARYADEMGPAPGGGIPTILATWAGPTRGVSSMGGSTLPGMIVMRFEGEGVLTGTRTAAHSNLWFIAHEAAHFWLGQAVTYQTARDGWITEGGADLLAVRTIAATEPDYDWRAELQRGVDDCVTLSRGRGVATALERNEYRAYYACGSVFALVAEAASRRPFTRFVRDLIVGSRDDRVVTRTEWLAELDRVSRDRTLSRDIGRMLDAGSANPAATIASLFQRAGVPHRAVGTRIVLQ
jgi:hypothetical protein